MLMINVPTKATRPLMTSIRESLAEQNAREHADQMGAAE
jgi:hypothetical protein